MIMMTLREAGMAVVGALEMGRGEGAVQSE